MVNTTAPEPKWTPLHALAAGLDFEGYFRLRRSRDGDPFRVRFPGLGSVLFTGTPEGAREVFRAPAALLEPPRPNPIEPMVGPTSLILTSGARHRRDRALLAPAFHGARVREYAEVMRSATLDEIARAGWRPGARVDSRAAARAITLRVVMTAIFGAAGVERRAEYRAAITEFLTAFTGPLLLVPALRHGAFGRAPWDRFAAARARLDRLVLADIAARRAAPPSDADLLGLLLSTRYDDGSAPTDADLADQLRTLLVAGHETTATTLVWLLFHLHRAPGALQAIRDELATAGSEAADLVGLPYLDAACQETLRLHPPVPIVLRRVTEPFTLRGAALAAGDTMGIAVPLLHSDPAVWPDADRFRPERFLERRYSPFEFAPFGGGHRRCVGATLAEYELRIVAATLLTHVRLRLPDRWARGRPPRAVPHNIAAGPRRAIPFDVIE
ncbi:cytochrome P450 [Nocardia puris]|uniref:cytochrome P450 n=1 Tax=Nocardia puris TaxID=208602 RepID=UPI0018957641|nr:cytochrome P450 [Nocardia puris]MBF6213644.1 cytochrome P450 [Nocardia puris]MBF6365426.1 cytochrome P450 [Nocardia puris]MBF6459892.1 cytochrome P450 [Nocardia puris]